MERYVGLYENLRPLDKRVTIVRGFWCSCVGPGTNLSGYRGTTVLISNRYLFI